MLNAISDRIAKKKGTTLDGEVLINDKYRLDQKRFGQFATYVMQDDCLFGYFTVREALRFAARLKLKISHEQTEQRIEKLITDLGL